MRRFFALLTIVTAMGSVCATATFAESKPGLVAAYDDGQQSVSEIVPTPHFRLGAGQSIHPQVAPTFSANWTGVLKIARAGQYRLTGHPSATILVAGKPIAELTQLATGEHPLEIRLERDGEKPISWNLRWASEYFREEPTPSEALGHTDVPASLSAQQPIERGRFLFGESGCGNCHVSASWGLANRRGPDLTAAGGRLSASWLHQWLDAPKSYRPAAVMPRCSANAQEQADIAAYVMSLGAKDSDAGTEKAPDAVLALGKSTFETVGCVKCHDKQNNLDTIGSKYTSIASLAEFIADPHQQDPHGRMPQVFTTNERHLATAVASHLFATRKAKPADVAAAPAGNAASGAKLFGARGCANCHVVAGRQFTTEQLLNGPAFGSRKQVGLGAHWSFDGKDQREVRNAVSDSVERVSGRTAFAAGRSQDSGAAFDFNGRTFIEVQHFPRPGVMTISAWVRTQKGGSIVTWARAGGELRGSRELRMNIGQDGKNSLCYGEYNSDGGWRPVVVRPTDVNLIDGKWHHIAVVRKDTMIQHYVDGKPQGKPGRSQPSGGDYTERLLIGALGLQSNPSNRFQGQMDDLSVWTIALSPEQIQSLAEGQSPLEMARPKQVTLKPFDVSGGCLADRVEKPLPDYQFSENDRGSLRAFLQTIQPKEAAEDSYFDAPLTQHRLRIQQFRCTACHQWNDQNIQRGKRINDDGQIVTVERPPLLTGVGEKLTAARLEDVLLNQKRNRPWLQLRMPHFGAQLATMPEWITAEAGMPAQDAAPKPDRKLAEAGLKIIGQQRGKAACITCHNYRGINRRKDGVVPAPDLAEAGRTIRRNWFLRWMHDPQRLQPGTSMPQMFLDVSKDERQQKIDQLWSALVYQAQLPLPEGVLERKTEGTKIVVKDKPVLFRMATVTPVGQIDRAINVGIPGGLNYTFDPVDCQLKYVWKGDFIDAGPAWNGRGGNPVRAAGQSLVAAKSGRHRLVSPTNADSRQFLGYRIVEGLPVFRYRIGEATIEQRIDLAQGQVTQSFVVRGAEGEWSYLDSKEAPAETKTGKREGDKLVFSTANQPLEFTVTIPLGE